MRQSIAQTISSVICTLRSRIRIVTLGQAAIVLLITAASATAQYSLDKYPPPLNPDGSFVIELAHPAVAGHEVLQPGSYTVHPIQIAGADLPVLRIRGDNGVTLAIPVAPTFREFGPPENEVTYYKVGHNYYLHRMWVQGLNYGYKFRVPKRVRREVAK